MCCSDAVCPVVLLGAVVSAHPPPPQTSTSKLIACNQSCDISSGLQKPVRNEKQLVMGISEEQLVMDISGSSHLPPPCSSSMAQKDAEQHSRHQNKVPSENAARQTHHNTASLLWVLPSDFAHPAKTNPVAKPAPSPQVIGY